MYGVGWEGRVGTWGLLCEAENVLAHLRPRREKGQDSLSKLCLSSQHNTLDRWLDGIEVQPQGEGQVCQCAPTPCSRNLGGGVVTMMMRRKNVPPQVCSFPTLDKMHTCVAGECTGGGDAEAQEAAGGVQVSGHNDDRAAMPTHGPQVPGLDPVMGWGLLATNWGLGRR